MTRKRLHSNFLNPFSDVAGKNAGRNAKTMEDRALSRRLSNKLEQGLQGTGVKGVQFYVREGVVAIYGMVKDTEQRDLIRSLIQQVSGVRSIDMQIQVLDPTMLMPRNRRTPHSQRA